MFSEIFANLRHKINQKESERYEHEKISEAILGVGVDDTTIDLFESQYPVPTGVSYNSYVILDEKTTILDTVDARATEPWLENLAEALGGRKPAYLVVSHMEPDHGANVAKLAALYPEMQVVATPRPSSIWSSSLAQMPLPRSAAW